MESWLGIYWVPWWGHQWESWWVLEYLPSKVTCVTRRGTKHAWMHTCMDAIIQDQLQKVRLGRLTIIAHDSKFSTILSNQIWLLLPDRWVLWLGP